MAFLQSALNGTSALLGYIVPFILDVVEKYKSEIIYYMINNMI